MDGWLDQFIIIWWDRNSWKRLRENANLWCWTILMKISWCLWLRRLYLKWRIKIIIIFCWIFIRTLWAICFEVICFLLLKGEWCWFGLRLRCRLIHLSGLGWKLMLNRKDVCLLKSINLRYFWRAISNVEIWYEIYLFDIRFYFLKAHLIIFQIPF